MMTDEKRKAINDTIDRAMEVGPVTAMSWLRSAYHTHEGQLEDVLAKLRELRGAFLAATNARPLTVREAQMCNVCRVCRTPPAEKREPFVLNYGDEFAHEGCLSQKGGGA